MWFGEKSPSKCKHPFVNMEAGFITVHYDQHWILAWSRKVYGFLYMKMYCPENNLSRFTYLELRRTIVYQNAL